ncbi:hypothetical protein ABVF33_01335 [Candidatus Rickettsia barbariae]
MCGSISPLSSRGLTPSALPVPATMPCEERSGVAISLKLHEIVSSA